MDKLIINGPCKLSGEVLISSSKNATLPILAATILLDSKTTFKNLPELVDVKTMLKLLTKLGMTVEKDSNAPLTFVSTEKLTSFEAPYDLVSTMRASILVLGPMLAKYGKSKISLPGGCAIGGRPIDIHLMGLEKMGAKIEFTNGYVMAQGKLIGTTIPLSFPSVGATENLMMAATLATGTTIIKNAAAEPEIIDLAHFLIKCGAKISGAGTHEITICGVTSLKGCEYEVIGDRIEAATYLIAGIMTNSEITIKNINPDYLEGVIAILKQMNANIEVDQQKFEIRTKVRDKGELRGVTIETAPYPGFPTDVQAQLMALATIAKSPSIITEHIFENRYMHVPELMRLGAKITLKGSTAVIEGSSQLKGAFCMCTDLRASAALVLAALVAEGESHIQRIYHLDRGYEKLEQKLKKLNAKIERVKA
ncbi:MAG: UDP-N-acetylglucosamine 1-carboxyvinyltransferase [Bacteriovoracaceae bacterium]